MTYSSPGNADQLSAETNEKWQEEIVSSYLSLGTFHSRFFAIDPTSIGQSIEVPVSWFGDPAEPNFCFNEDVARKLSNWGVRGRHQLHNEYCEYVTKYVIDSTGRSRPKRVSISTELREYWVVLAVNDSLKLREVATSILGYEPSWSELYGVADPTSLSARDKLIRFCTQCAGHGNDQNLASAGVPAQPVGALNRENILFMTHPINGLDDLLYIVMFGARPYSRQTSAGRAPATKEQIFREFEVEHLACRHADPTAATAAHAQAYLGKAVAFANPLGVYINAFTADVFEFEGAPIPQSWVTVSRGGQRLEFGPPDSLDVYLDDINVTEGQSSAVLSGGYEIVKRIEVGPRLVISVSGHIQESEYIELANDTSNIKCSEAGVCTSIRKLKDEYEAQEPIVKVAPRTMAIVG